MANQNQASLYFYIGNGLHFYDFFGHPRQVSGIGCPSPFWKRSCSTCRRKGHTSEFCDLDKTDPWCSYCTYAGHFAVACPERLFMNELLLATGYVTERINENDVLALARDLPHDFVPGEGPNRVDYRQATSGREYRDDLTDEEWAEEVAKIAKRACKNGTNPITNRRQVSSDWKMPSLAGSLASARMSPVPTAVASGPVIVPEVLPSVNVGASSSRVRGEPMRAALRATLRHRERHPILPSSSSSSEDEQADANEQQGSTIASIENALVSLRYQVGNNTLALAALQVAIETLNYNIAKQADSKSASKRK